MRVLACGGRAFMELDYVDRALDALHARTPVTVLIHGDARGADKAAGSWARRRGVRVETYKADWNSAAQRAAGILRNTKMLVEGKPELVVAFPGGTGTANMVSQSKRAGVPIWFPRAPVGVPSV